MQLAEAEYGDAINWDEEEELEGLDNSIFQKYIIPQLKTTKVCEDVKDCFASSYSSLDGSENITSGGEFLEGYGKNGVIILSDGASLAVIGALNYGLHLIRTDLKDRTL